MDQEEDLLFSLFTDYRDRFDCLDQTMRAGELTQEYARGGCTLHRGFYCPSPVLDIIIGGNDRGRLVRKPRSRLPIDYLYLKEDNELRIVDKYWLRSDGTSCLYQREFITENNNEKIAPIYRMTSDQHELFFLSLCRYDPAGRIILYLTFLPCCLPRGPKFHVDKKKCQFYGEQYSYDEKTGLLDTVVSGQKFDSYSSEYAYRFFHDTSGQIISYQRIADEPYNVIRMIPKGKRRIV